MSIQENLRRIRTERRLSQPKLAKLAGVSQQLISQLENGRNRTTKELPEIARALNVSIYEIDENYSPDVAGAVANDVPLISWVSAGELASQPGVTDLSDFKRIPTAGLPPGNWIALRVEGASMNKVSPPDSIIFVDLDDKRLVANGCYVITDETGSASYKRYRPNDKPPFQPASYKKIDPPKLEGAINVVGRVRRTVLDM